MRDRLTDIWYCINQENFNLVEDVYANPSGAVTSPEGEGIMHYTIEITHSCTTNLSRGDNALYDWNNLFLHYKSLSRG